MRLGVASGTDRRLVARPGDLLEVSLWWECLGMDVKGVVMRKPKREVIV